MIASVLQGRLENCPQYQLAVELSRLTALSTADSTCVMMRHVCIHRELNADVVLSGGKDISLQSVMKCDVCIRRELYAECRVVGGTAVFQGLVERMHASVYGPFQQPNPRVS